MNINEAEPETVKRDGTATVATQNCDMECFSHCQAVMAVGYSRDQHQHDENFRTCFAAVAEPWEVKLRAEDEVKELQLKNCLGLG